jgi:hypothetical protein
MKGIVMSRMMLLTLVGLGLVVNGCHVHKHRMAGHPQAVTTAKAPVKPAPVAPAPAPAPVVKPVAVPAVSPAPAGDWKVAYTANFKDAVAGDDFLKLEAVVKPEGGALLVTPEAESHHPQIVLKKSFPGNAIRVEFTGSLSGQSVSDLSLVLNAGEEGYSGGYLLQLGGKANTLSRLLKNGEFVEGTEGKFAVTPDKTYKVVAENDNGKITLTVDGKVIFTYTDKEPLKGPQHDKIGFYTYRDTMKIDSLVISTK